MKRRKWNKFSQSSSQRIVAKMFMEIRENINSRRVGIVLPSPPFFQFSEQSPIFVADERFKNRGQKEREREVEKKERALFKERRNQRFEHNRERILRNKTRLKWFWRAYYQIGKRISFSLLWWERFKGISTNDSVALSWDSIYLLFFYLESTSCNFTLFEISDVKEAKEKCIR